MWVLPSDFSLNFHLENVDFFILSVTKVSCREARRKIGESLGLELVNKKDQIRFIKNQITADITIVQECEYHRQNSQ